MLVFDSSDSYSKREGQDLCIKQSMRAFNCYLSTTFAETLPHSVELKLKQCSQAQLMEQSIIGATTLQCHVLTRKLGNMPSWPTGRAGQYRNTFLQATYFKIMVRLKKKLDNSCIYMSLAFISISIRQLVCPISRAILHQVNTRELSIPLPRQQKFQNPTPTLVPQADPSLIHPPHPMQGIASRPFLPVPPFNGNILSVSKFVFLQT